jgi:disulfide bond formation protein DsbB
MRRAIGILLLTGLLLVLVWPLPALTAASQSTGATTSGVALRADFNGDGTADLAIGAPGENNSAGAVHVLYGSAPAGLTAAGSQLWSQNSAGIAGNAEPGDIFGFALAAGDFNGDTRADLAIGAPGENDFAGLVHVLYGSAAGLTAAGSQVWWQASPGIAGNTEPRDGFGFALAAGDFNGDTRADLAIGALGENNAAGLVHVLYGSAAGLTAAGSQVWWQASPGIAGDAEPSDEFGFALAAGDFNGDTRADLAIGAPGENGFAGLVHVLYGSAAGLTAAGSQVWWQASPGIAGNTEPNDGFGFALAAGDFNGDTRADLAIGAPGENGFAGLVHVLYGSAPVGLTATGSQVWWQDSPGIADGSEPDDLFGEALAAGDFNGDTRADLAIGAPGENGFAGLVHVLYGSAPVGLTATGSQVWSQNSPGIADVAEAGDVFGETLAAGTLSIGGAGTANPAAISPAERSRTARERRP